MTLLRHIGGSGRGPGALAAILATAGLIAGLVLLQRPGAASSTASRLAAGAVPSSSATDVPETSGGAALVEDPVSYGLAEPAGSLPGVDTAADVTSWLQIRADLARSGSCWLRTDLDEWLTRAIDALPWLGSGGPCAVGAGAPVKVLAIIDDQTVWSAWRLCPNVDFSAAYDRHHTNFTLDDWAAIVNCLAGEYKGRISAYEIWNEPVLDDSSMGYEDGSAAHYLDLLRVADLAIKAVDPSATVIALGGSDAYAGGDRQRLAQMDAFSSQLVALGARRYADAVSVHAYPWGRTDASVWASYGVELAFQSATWRLPVWITETGTRATDPGTQVAYADTAYSLFLRADVRHVFWFSITDQPDGAFGARGRPVEAALASFVRAHL